jgi:flagellar basal body-associated protein FliL
MSKEIMIVLVLTAIAVAGVVWLEIKSRRNSRERAKDSTERAG